MSMCLQRDPLRTDVPTRHLPVFGAGAFRTIEGVNEGDPLADASDLVLGDVYALAEQATPVRLGLVTGGRTGPPVISRDSGAGRPGAALYPDSLLTFLAPAGGIREALVLVEVAADGTIAEVYLYPLAAFTPKRRYALVRIDCDGARARLAGCTGLAGDPAAEPDAPQRPAVGRHRDGGLADARPVAPPQGRVRAAKTAEALAWPVRGFQFAFGLLRTKPAPSPISSA